MIDCFDLFATGRFQLESMLDTRSTFNQKPSDQSGVSAERLDAFGFMVCRFSVGMSGSLAAIEW